MQYRMLGRTKLSVSAVSLGAWQVGGAATLTFDGLGTIPHGWGCADDAESIDLIDRCGHAGVNFIDTAPIYGDGHSEEVVGRAVRARRDQWIVCTKGGHGAANRVAWTDFSRSRILEQVEQSLARLRMEAVDLYLLHNPSESDVRRGECLEALSAIRSQGKARFVGVSIGPNEMGVSLMEQGVVDVLQQSISIINPGAAGRLLPAAVTHDVGIIAREVFGAGFLAGAVTPQTAFTPDDRRTWYPPANLQALASKAGALGPLIRAGRSAAQLAVQYVLQLPGVSTVIAGTRQWAHMRENIGALDAPPLTPNELKLIGSVQARG